MNSSCSTAGAGGDGPLTSVEVDGWQEPKASCRWRRQQEARRGVLSSVQLHGGGVSESEVAVAAEAEQAGGADDSQEAAGEVRGSPQHLRTTGRRRSSRTGRRKVTQYLVKWRGYDDSDNTWMKEEDPEHARGAVDDYEHQQRLERGEEAVAVMVVTEDSSASFGALQNQDERRRA